MENSEKCVTEGTYLDANHGAMLQEEVSSIDIERCPTYGADQRYVTPHPVLLFLGSDDYLCSEEGSSETQSTSYLESGDNKEMGLSVLMRSLPVLVHCGANEEPTAEKQAGHHASITQNMPRTFALLQDKPLNIVGPSGTSAVSDSSPALSQRNKAPQCHILNELAQIKRAQAELKKGLQKVIDMQTMILNQNPDQVQAQDLGVPPSLGVAPNLGVPLQTVQDVDVLEARLHFAVQDALIRGLSSNGGVTVPDIIHKIMQELRGCEKQSGHFQSSHC